MSVLRFERPFAPIGALTIAELAVVIAAVRRPGTDLRAIASETGRWLDCEIKPPALGLAVGALAQREWIIDQGGHLTAIEAARAEAERAAKGIVRLCFRDRFFFDVAKLLEVTLVKEDWNGA